MLKHDVMMNTNNERIGENYLLLIFCLVYNYGAKIRKKSDIHPYIIQD